MHHATAGRAALRLLLSVSAAFPLLVPSPASGQAGMARARKPFPRAGAYDVLKADLHTHTVFSDGQVWPRTCVMEAWRDDLDAIAITDHDTYHPNAEDLRPDPNRPHALVRALAESLGILYVPGVEITRGDLHFNALFVTDANAFRELDLPGALAEARRQGAFCFWNHPGWKGRAEWVPEVASARTKGLFQGIELYNGLLGQYYGEARQWVEQHGLTVLANSDIHNPSLPDQPRALTLALVRERSLQGLREALEAGRTIAWDGRSRLYGRRQWLRLLLEACLALNGPVRRGPGFQYDVLVPLRNQSALRLELRPGKLPAGVEALPLDLPPMSDGILQVKLAGQSSRAGAIRLPLEVAGTLAVEDGLAVQIEFEILPPDPAP
jgi:predicted metal-dependent phosphoesterase TrpH